jgi:hypothetical protein
LEKRIITLVQRILVATGIGLGIVAFYSQTYALFAVSIILFGIAIAIRVYLRDKAKTKAYLLQSGQLIRADITDISLNQSIMVNGKSPFQIIAQWHDKTNNQMYIYKSDNFWFNPTQFVSDKTISVYIDLNNPKKYHMDTSFLPKQ